MPVQVDVSLTRGTDFNIPIVMNPPIPMGSQTVEFRVTKRFGGISGLIVKSMASGYCNNESGITLTNSGQGYFNVAINANDTSGWNFTSYTHRTQRMDSGFNSVYALGFLTVDPND